MAEPASPRFGVRVPRTRGQGSRWRRARLIAAFGCALALAAAAVIWLPPLIVGIDLLGRGTARLADRELAASVNDVRNTLLQAAVGAVLLATAYAGWRQYVLGQQTQLTDRYRDAVKLLGDVDPAARTGGIYALERLARDSRVDKTTISDVLAALIRSRARAAEALAPWEPDNVAYYDEVGYLGVRAPDVQAALTVLGRFGQDWSAIDDPKGTPLHLVQVDLRRSNLFGAQLVGVDLTESHLEIAQLSNADLRRARLSQTRLDGAYIFGTNFSEVDLADAFLRGAEADASTVFPAGFDPIAAGVRLRNG